MGFQSASEYTPLRYRIIWQHHWKDGSRIELTQDKEDWILTEYDAEGEPVYYIVQDGYGQSSSKEERYSKYNWTLQAAIADIKDEYGLSGGN